MWIIITLVSIVIFLILPVEICDTSPFIILFLGACWTAFCINRIGKHYFKEFKLHAIVIVIISLALGFAYLRSYDYRRANLFEEGYATTSGEITDKELKRHNSRSRYYIYYQYTVDGQVYEGNEDVTFEVFFNSDFGPTIEVDYVEDRPRISRINKNSLVEDPDAHEKFMQLQKEIKDSEAQ